MKVKLEALAKAGTYTNNQGTEKTKWHKCGVLFESDKGMSIKLDSLPVNFDGWITLFPPRENREGRPSTKSAPFDDMKDDVPW